MNGAPEIAAGPRPSRGIAPGHRRSAPKSSAVPNFQRWIKALGADPPLVPCPDLP